MEDLRKGEYADELASYVNKIKLIVTSYIQLAEDSHHKEAKSNVSLTKDLKLYLDENKYQDNWNTLLDYLGTVLSGCKTKTKRVEKTNESSTFTTVYDYISVNKVNQFKNNLESLIFSGYVMLAKLQDRRATALEKQVEPLNEKIKELKGEIKTLKEKHKTKKNRLKQENKTLNDKLGNAREEKGKTSGELQGVKEHLTTVKKTNDNLNGQVNEFAKFMTDIRKSQNTRALEGPGANGASKPRSEEELRSRLITPKRLVTRERFDFIKMVALKHLETQNNANSDDTYVKLLESVVEGVCSKDKPCALIVKDLENGCERKLGLVAPEFKNEADDKLGEDKASIAKYVGSLLRDVCKNDKLAGKLFPLDNVADLGNRIKF